MVILDRTSTENNPVYSLGMVLKKKQRIFDRGQTYPPTPPPIFDRLGFSFLLEGCFCNERVVEYGMKQNL